MSNKFVVNVHRDVASLLRQTTTPREVRVAYVDVYRMLSRRGCAAADYRLSGEHQWPRHCVKRLPRGWRLVMDFPSKSEVRLLILAPHNRESDPYLMLATMLGVERDIQVDREKPPCCDDNGLPPGSPA